MEPCCFMEYKCNCFICGWFTSFTCASPIAYSPDAIKKIMAMNGYQAIAVPGISHFWGLSVICPNCGDMLSMKHLQINLQWHHTHGAKAMYGVAQRVYESIKLGDYIIGDPVVGMIDHSYIRIGLESDNRARVKRYRNECDDSNKHNRASI